MADRKIIFTFFKMLYSGLVRTFRIAPFAELRRQGGIEKLTTTQLHWELWNLTYKLNY